MGGPEGDGRSRLQERGGDPEADAGGLQPEVGRVGADQGRSRSGLEKKFEVPIS